MSAHSRLNLRLCSKLFHHPVFVSIFLYTVLLGNQEHTGHSMQVARLSRCWPTSILLSIARAEAVAAVRKIVTRVVKFMLADVYLSL